MESTLPMVVCTPWKSPRLAPGYLAKARSIQNGIYHVYHFSHLPNAQEAKDVVFLAVAVVVSRDAGRGVMLSLLNDNCASTGPCGP